MENLRVKAGGRTKAWDGGGDEEGMGGTDGDMTSRFSSERIGIRVCNNDMQKQRTGPLDLTHLHSAKNARAKR